MIPEQPIGQPTSVQTERRRIEVRGVVQGVGFRPFVARLAAELGVSGYVGNDDARVFIEAEGPVVVLEELTRRLHDEAPPLAMVSTVTAAVVPLQRDRDFRIVESRHEPGSRTLVPADVATCPDCLAEMKDPANRRYRHAFATCTNCGPRFTIITDLPYDRPNTTMAGFPMCAACSAEYGDPSDRRYHAQPISCHDCGPRMWLEDDDLTVIGDDEVIASAQRALADGKIVAVKGIGGFHLVCDATNPDAVDRLRERKRRPDKPFALMVPDLAAAREIVHVTAEAATVLSRPSRPIVLLPAAGRIVAPAVAPGLDELGVMLPYSPLHHLLFMPVPGREMSTPQVLVMTSANLSDEPLCYENDDARSRLACIADAFLMHDRPIAVPCEDSVVMMHDGAEVPVRRSRGFAPLPVALGSRGPVTLAVGAEVKNTFCLVKDDLAFCSAHLGDMGTLASRRAFERSVAQLSALRDVQPELLVADDHPGYDTHRWAEDESWRRDVPLLTVQHHHAHVASLLAEHGRVGTPVIGVAFDGTGYGCDKHVWGGELLYVGEDVGAMERLGHLREFPLVGGDAAVRSPFRIAMALAREAGYDWRPGAVADAETAAVASQLAAGQGVVPTSSAGRLFDGVASLLGVRHRVGYEAQAAIELEALARSTLRPHRLHLPVVDGLLDWRRLIAEVIAARTRGVDSAALALGFHEALALATVRAALRMAEQREVTTVGLTGGVFQNRLLLQGVAMRLERHGIEVLTHRRVPANDGGLCLGQAVVARARWARPPVADEGDD